MDGKKTWTGIIIVLLGFLGVDAFILPGEVNVIYDNLFEIVGIAFASYGNWKAHKKLK